MAKKSKKIAPPFNPSKAKVKAVLEKHGYLHVPHHGYKDWPKLGANCGDGWAPIIDMLLTELEELDVSKKWEKSGAQIDQIKEKFGLLTFYSSTPNDEGRARVHRAAIFSALTCENCGNVGVPRERSWALTLCNKCTDTETVSPITFYLNDWSKQKNTGAYAAVAIIPKEDIKAFTKWREDILEAKEAAETKRR